MRKLTIWLNKLVKRTTFLLLCLPCFPVAAQEAWSLDRLYEAALANYPEIRQQALLQQTDRLSLANFSTGNLPQVTINGQATYQSAVTEIPVSIPNISIPSPSKDQYKFYADVSQTLYDGGMIRQQKNIQRLSTAVALQQSEASLYQLKVRISQLYLNILYQDALLLQSKTVEKDIQAGILKVQPQVENGTMLRSNLQVLQVQLLQARQRSLEIRHTRSGLVAGLTLLLGKPLPDTVALALPEGTATQDTILTRPELGIYQRQLQLIEGQKKMVHARNLPRFSLFGQGGYAKPALNFLSNEFEWYYVAGIRLNWSLGGLYTGKRERQVLSINQQSVQIQEDLFRLNTQTELARQQSEIAKATDLIATDKEIVDLRGAIKETAKNQLDLAVITANDYLRELNAEDQARQALAIHKLQLLQAELNYKLTAGKP